MSKLRSFSSVETRYTSPIPSERERALRVPNNLYT